MHDFSKVLARSIPLLAALACAGCTEDADSPAPGGDDGLLDPPAAGQGIQLRMTTTIGAGVEAEHCRFLRAPAGEDLWVRRDEVRFTQGSHHVLLFETAYDEIPTEKDDGTPVATDGVFDCTDGATNGWSVTKLVGGSQNGEGDSLLYFPEGVAMKVRAGAVLLMNTHYVNASGQTLHPDVRMNLYTVPHEAVHTEGDILFLYNPFIGVPALGKSRARWRCPVHQDITLSNVQSHMHARGKGYAAMVTGQAPFYESSTWENVPVKRFEPGFQIAAGSSLDYWCDYSNAEPRDVYQGPRSTDEMCMLIGSYYPADPRTSACLDADGAKLAGEWVGNGKASCAETMDCVQKAPQSDNLHAITDCMLAASPDVSKEASAALLCASGSDNPSEDCAAEFSACMAK